MSVVISDEILQASQLSPGEFRQEIALYLFQTGRLTPARRYVAPGFSPTAQAAKRPTLLIRC